MSLDALFDVLRKVPVGSICASILVILFAQWYRRKLRLIAAVNLIPGPTLSSARADFHPFLANIVAVSATLGQIPNYPDIPSIIPVFRKWCDEFSEEGLFRIWAFNPFYVPFARVLVMVVDPELCRQLLEPIEASKKLKKNPRIFGLSAPVVGDSLLALNDNAEWKHQRRITTPAFSQRVLENACAVAYKLLDDTLFPYLDQGRKGVESAELSTRLTAEILGQVAFSYTFNGMNVYSSNTSNDSKSHVQSLYQTYMLLLKVIGKRTQAAPYTEYLPTSENRAFRKASKLLDSVIRTIVDTRLSEQIEEEKNGKTKAQRRDLLSQLLLRDEDGSRLNQQYIFGNVRMFLFAGHDTTAAILANALWELGNDLNSQERLRKEVDTLYATSNRPTYKELRNLVFLDAVLKEVLRLHSSVGIARDAAEDIYLTKETEAGSKTTYCIPKGTSIHIFPIYAQTMKKYWPNRPLEFVPDRWIDEPRSKNWLPFSIGPRNCMGRALAMAELKAVIVHTVRHYSFCRHAKAPDPIPVLLLTIKPHMVLLDFERRKDLLH